MKTKFTPMKSIKKFEISYEVDNGVFEYSTIYLGKVKDIKAMYKSIIRKGNESRIIPTFVHFPKFNQKTYGILIKEGKMSVITGQTFVLMMFDRWCTIKEI